MSAKYFDQNNESNPDNGAALTDGPSAKAMLKRQAVNRQVFCELISEERSKLLVGLGPSIGCAQFTNADGEPPYLVAKLDSEDSREGFADFMIGNEPSEVPLRLCLPLHVLLEVAAYFVETGKRSPLVSWEEL